MNTLDYYNKNANEYFNKTIDIDMRKQYNLFLKYVKENGKILDFGCGSGRDSLYFKDLGYDVTAIDGSNELCKLASKYTGLDVKCMDFNDLCDIDEYDGIWACSSILHVKRSELINILKKMRDALKEEGCIFTSFQNSGKEEQKIDGRYFNDLTYGMFSDFASKSNLEIVSYRKNPVLTTSRTGDIYWSSYILKKK